MYGHGPAWLGEGGEFAFSNMFTCGNVALRDGGSLACAQGS